MPILRTHPTRFAGFARALCAASTLFVAACSGGGSDSPTSPGGNTTNQTIANVSVTGNVTGVNVGASVTLGALAINSSGTTVTATFTWASSNTAVATVGASTGTVTGVAPGNATISASAGGFTGSRAMIVSTPGVPGPAPQAAQVNMPGSSFEPADVTIAIGGTVTWVFTEIAHNVIFGGGAGKPVDIDVSTDKAVPRTFNIAGSFTQLCTLHAGMTGTITVR